MRPRIAKRLALGIAFLVIFPLVLTSCGEEAESSFLDVDWIDFDLDQSAISGEGAVTRFIGEPFYDGKIKSDEDAYKAVYSVLDEIGGDASTELVLKTLQPTEDGISYYVFAQAADMMEVDGASIKLIVDKKKQAIGLVSTIVPNLEIDPDQTWEITEQEAEEIVKQNVPSGSGIKVIQGATEGAVVPVTQNTGTYVYSWVVYTNNINSNDHAPYTAHYIAADGTYLYSVPVSGLGKEEALTGSVSSFAFDSGQYEAGEWSGTVTKHDGTTEDLTLPVMIDVATGETILGDLKRKVLCADYADFNFKDTLTPRTSKDNSFAGNELLIYRAFLDVYDLYDEAGWTGPDGQETASLLLMDMVDENGSVIRNAYYGGLSQGFRTFMFNREDPDGECYDIIAHEFTHCVTETAMKGTVYKNESGAINEAMSDILGNIVEAYLGKTTDTTWLIDENSNHPIRSMSDPNRFQQPAFAWDRYYVPPAVTTGGFNDYGGVHFDSSLLNVIGYALNASGMPLEDQMYFWMNVSFAMTPQTDYMLLAQLLPWCMELFGYSDYVDDLNAAIEKSGITDFSVPENLPEGTGMIYMEFPESFSESMPPFNVLIYDTEDLEETLTWPDANSDIVLSTLDEGNYFIVITFYDGEEKIESAAIANSEGWKLLSPGELEDFLAMALAEDLSADYIASLREGEVLEIETKTLAAALE